MATSKELHGQGHQAFENGMRDPVLDLSDVPYMSSARIRALNDTFRLLRGDSPIESDAALKQGLSDGTFKSPHPKLVNPNRHVQEVLGMSGVDSLDPGAWRPSLWRSAPFY